MLQYWWNSILVGNQACYVSHLIPLLIEQGAKE